MDNRMCGVLAVTVVFLMLAISASAVDYEPGDALSTEFHACSPGESAHVYGAGHCDLWTCIEAVTEFTAYALDLDHYDDPEVQDCTFLHWYVEDLDSNGQVIEIDIGTQAGPCCQHPAHHTITGTSDISHIWNKAGTYNVRCVMDDCPKYAGDPSVEVSCTVHVIGGELIQVSPDPEQFPLPHVYYTCAGGEDGSIVYQAIPEQPAGTIFHWTLDDYTTACLGGASDGCLRSAGADTVTVKAKNALDTDPPHHPQNQVHLWFEHGLPQNSSCESSAQLSFPAMISGGAHFVFFAQTATGVTYHGNQDADPLPPGFVWFKIGHFCVTDQVGGPYERKVLVQECRPNPWCIDGFGNNKPETRGGNTGDDGCFPDWLSITEPGRPADWCAKARQQWAPGGANEHGGWFCQQWFSTTGTWHTGECYDCNTCQIEGGE